MSESTTAVPAIPVRIVLLLVLTAALAGARPGVLLIAALLLVGVGLHGRHGLHGGYVALRALLRRVRWLLLAMLILYGWFMPGTPLWPVLGELAPSREGLQEGMLRVAALVLIVVAVYLLLSSTARGPLVAGLLWFGRPLRRVGLNDARFAVRLVLALEAVGQVQDLMTTTAGNLREGTWQRVGRSAAGVVQATLARADQAHTGIDIPDVPPVPRWQWLLPLGLAVPLWVAAQW